MRRRHYTQSPLQSISNPYRGGSDHLTAQQAEPEGGIINLQQAIGRLRHKTSVFEQRKAQLLQKNNELEKQRKQQEQNANLAGNRRHKTAAPTTKVWIDTGDGHQFTSNQKMIEEFDATLKKNAELLSRLQKELDDLNEQKRSSTKTTSKILMANEPYYKNHIANPSGQRTEEQAAIYPSLTPKKATSKLQLLYDLGMVSAFAIAFIMIFKKLSWQVTSVGIAAMTMIGAYIFRRQTHESKVALQAKPQLPIHSFAIPSPQQTGSDKHRNALLESRQLAAARVGSVALQ